MLRFHPKHWKKKLQTTKGQKIPKTKPAKNVEGGNWFWFYPIFFGDFWPCFEDTTHNKERNVKIAGSFQRLEKHSSMIGEPAHIRQTFGWGVSVLVWKGPANQILFQRSKDLFNHNLKTKYTRGQNGYPPAALSNSPLWKITLIFRSVKQ